MGVGTFLKQLNQLAILILPACKPWTLTPFFFWLGCKRASYQAASSEDRIAVPRGTARMESAGCGHTVDEGLTEAKQSGNLMDVHDGLSL